MNIELKGIKELLEHIENTISQDEIERIFHLGSNSLDEMDICGWLFRKLNLKLEDVFNYSYIIGDYSNKGFSIRGMNRLVDYINNTLTVEKRYEIFGKHNRITISDIGHYLTIYLDTCVSSEFNFYDFERYISF